MILLSGWMSILNVFSFDLFETFNQKIACVTDDGINEQLEYCPDQSASDSCQGAIESKTSKSFTLSIFIK